MAESSTWRFRARVRVRAVHLNPNPNLNPNPSPDPNLRREATLCFFWSLPVTSDEIKRRMWMLNMRFVDFLEALARVVMFKALPTDELLQECKAQSAAHFFKQARARGRDRARARVRVRGRDRVS